MSALAASRVEPEPSSEAIAAHDLTIGHVHRSLGLLRSATRGQRIIAAHITFRLQPGQSLVILGPNGAGKTTTIGKLAQVFRAQGKTVLLCAADTFRAAAIEQLEVWGQRTGTEVIKTKPGGDPAAVIFDALQAAILMPVASFTVLGMALWMQTFASPDGAQPCR